VTCGEKKKYMSIDMLEIEMTRIGNLSAITSAQVYKKHNSSQLGELLTLIYIFKFSLVLVFFFVTGKALHLRW
jgi:hypothetical protein